MSDECIRTWCSASPVPRQWQSGLHGGRGKLGLGQTQCPYKPRKPSLRRRAHIVNLSVPHQLGTLVGSSRLLWYWPEVFRPPGHTVNALTKSPYVKGNPASLAIPHPTHVLRWPHSLCTQSAVSTERPVGRAHTWARASFPVARGYRRRGKHPHLRTASGACKQIQMSFVIS